MRPGRAVFRAALRLLPDRVIERLCDEMLAVYDARMAEAAGPVARTGVWLSEVAGALAAARRLRGSGRVRTGSALWRADVRGAVRVLRRRPGYALLAVLTCGLGVGSATAMFSVVDGVLLRPMPYAEPERVVALYPTIEEWRGHPSLGATWDRGAFSQAEFVDWWTEQTSFSEAALVSVVTRYLTERGPASLVRTGFATAGLFPLVEARAEAGRLFDATDGTPGAPQVALVSRGFAEARLGGTENVMGATVVLNDVGYTVVGVVPDRIRHAGYDAEVWLPVSLVPDERQRENHNYRVIGRLADGVTMERAEAESARILRALSAHHDGSFTHGANVEPRLADLTRAVRAPLLVLLGAALVLLLAACANFAGLQLGAGLDRTTELAIRGALGAGRRRITGMLLTESTLLALFGGLAGVLFALALTRGLVLLAPPDVPRIDEVAVDARALVVALGLSVLAGVAFGAAPALALGRDDMATRLRGARSVTRQRHRLQASLVVAQVGMATLLLVVSGLLGRTLLHLDAVDPRFEPDGLMTVRVAVPGYRFLDADGTFRRAAYAARFDAIEAALAAVPGVTAVARASTLPFDGGRANNRIEPEGYAAAPGEQLVGERTFVSGDYLRVIGARLLEGRLLEPADDRADAPPVMVVSQRLARRFWPDGSALGRRIGFWAGEFTVVGVIEDMHDRSLEADEDLRFYVPAKVAGETADGFVLRTAGPPERHAAVVRERIAALDPDLPVLRVAAMRERMGATLSERRYRARLVLGFAALALVFAASGIYGAMNRRVALRRHEIGVRMALGARRTGVLAGVLRESVRLTLTGVVLGAALALACSRLVAAWLSGVPATDPLTYAAIALVLGATATLAALAPSLRAARVDPLDSLRGG